MITKITHITLYVNDQDAALEFYKKLGFAVHTDAMCGGMRWLTLNLPGHKDMELSIMKAENDHEISLVGKQGLTKPFICLESTDCRADYEALKNAGVEFAEEVNVQPWGISTTFKDLCGNLIYLVQPSEC